jgi:lipid-A-disaccharide synthase
MSDDKAEQPRLRIAITAGEASGDALGAGLIAALKQQAPQAEFVGVAGPRMRAEGCVAWHQSEELSVMGLAEVLKHLPRLLRLRRLLAKRLMADPPDIFVGIDSPDFNLPLAARLKAAGIPTVQYVSPQVWAWRQSRVKSIRRQVDLVLCVLPFETDFYQRHGVQARFVGHPLAEEIPLAVDRAAARRALGIDTDAPVLALLPGSRSAEVARLAEPFAATAAWLGERVPGLQTVVALASEGLRPLFEQSLAAVPLPPESRIVPGRAREVMAAADAVLTASGTASLEALLLKRPMVVAYRMTAFSYWFFRRMGIARLPHYTLPNLLAGRSLVPEFVQEQVRAEVLGPALLEGFEGRGLDESWQADVQHIHERLRQGGSAVAAAAVLELAGRGKPVPAA